MVSVHHNDRPFPRLSGSILLKEFINQTEIPAKINIKKLTKGSIRSQIIENPVMYPNKINPNKT